MADNCDRKHLGCKGIDGPIEVNRGRFSIAPDGTVTYTQDYLIASPQDAYPLLCDPLPGNSAFKPTGVSGRQDSCGEWIATVTYETDAGEVPTCPSPDCPPDEIVISGSAISSSWIKHPCFDVPVDGPPFNGQRPSCFWGIKPQDLPDNASPCFAGNPILEPLAADLKSSGDTPVPGFNYQLLLANSGFEDASKVFAGQTNFFAGSFEVQVTEYFNGSPPTIFGVVGYPGQPPGFPSTDGIYGTVMTGAAYEPGEGHPCGRRVLSYLLSTQPWPSINPNGCTVITPP